MLEGVTNRNDLRGWQAQHRHCSLVDNGRGLAHDGHGPAHLAVPFRQHARHWDEATWTIDRDLCVQG
eukprot:352986-Chlamydomonas_euryale.AAC.5